MSRLVSLLFALLCFALAPLAGAPVAIANPDFETNAPADGVLTSGSPAGWSGGTYRFNPGISTRYYNHPDFADGSPSGGARGSMRGPTFSGVFATGSTATMAQTLTTGLAADTNYTLRVALGHRSVDSGSAAIASAVTIELRAGGNLIATATANPAGGDWSDAASGTEDDDRWLDLVASATTGAAPPGLGQPLQIRLIKGASGDYMDVDHVRLEAVTPANPPQITFISSHSSVRSDDSFTLDWSVEGAESVHITPDLGTVSPSGSATLTLESSTTWTLLATAADGSTSQAQVSVAFSRGPIVVYLLGGQSNMQGLGRHALLPAELKIQDMLLYHSSPCVGTSPGPNRLVPLQPVGSDRFQFGPEIGFGAAMIGYRPATPICLIKHALGGTSLQMKWNPGANNADTDHFGPEYRTFINTVNGGLAALRADGWEPQIEGMLWQQGEQDSKAGVNTGGDGNSTSADDYGANLKHFVARVREQFAADIAPDGMRFVLGQIAPYYPEGGTLRTVYPERDTVRAAQLAADEDSGAALAISNTGVVPTNEVEFPVHEQIIDNYKDDDEAHLAEDALLLLGRRMAAEMLRLQPVAYTQWAADNQLVQGPEGDDDGDGLPNLAEFAGGSAGNDSGSRQVPRFSADLTQVSVQRNLNAENVSAVFQISEDLLNWQSLPAPASSELLEDGHALLLYNIPVLATGERCFVRSAYQLTD